MSTYNLPRRSLSRNQQQQKREELRPLTGRDVQSSFGRHPSANSNSNSPAAMAKHHQHNTYNHNNNNNNNLTPRRDIAAAHSPISRPPVLAKQAAREPMYTLPTATGRLPVPAGRASRDRINDVIQNNTNNNNNNVRQFHYVERDPHQLPQQQQQYTNATPNAREHVYNDHSLQHHYATNYNSYQNYRNSITEYSRDFEDKIMQWHTVHPTIDEQRAADEVVHDSSSTSMWSPLTPRPAERKPSYTRAHYNNTNNNNNNINGSNAASPLIRNVRAMAPAVEPEDMSGVVWHSQPMLPPL